MLKPYLILRHLMYSNVIKQCEHEFDDLFILKLKGILYDNSKCSIFGKSIYIFGKEIPKIKIYF
jgi:hypothetical protein